MPIFYSGGCYLCGENKQVQFHLCTTCLDTLPFIGEQILTEKRLPVYALLRENNLSAQMIKGLKYKEERHWKKVLGAMAADFIVHHHIHHVDGVLSVPTSAKKRRLRGYNPPELVAKELCERLNLPYIDRLHLSRNVKDQIGLSARDRQINVKDAFRSEPVRGRLLLVDDTYTTGATMAECAKALREAGAEEVVGLVCMKAADVPVE